MQTAAWADPRRAWALLPPVAVEADDFAVARVVLLADVSVLSVARVDRLADVSVLAFARVDRLADVSDLAFFEVLALALDVLPVFDGAVAGVPLVALGALWASTVHTDSVKAAAVSAHNPSLLTPSLLIFILMSASPGLLKILTTPTFSTYAQSRATCLKSESERSRFKAR